MDINFVIQAAGQTWYHTSADHLSALDKCMHSHSEWSGRLTMCYMFQLVLQGIMAEHQISCHSPAVKMPPPSPFPT